MKNWLLVFSGFLFFSTVIGQNSIQGTWNGMLEVGGVLRLRLVFHIRPKDNQLTATFDSPDQGAFGLPVSEVQYEHPTLKIQIGNINASFSGTVNDTYTLIEGTFRQAGQVLPLNLSREPIEKPVFRRPQEPKPPFPYYEEEVRFENRSASIHLSGTLTLPSKKRKHPVVVLVSGSGPQNRDEELPTIGHKPFLVLADYLTRQGIGVLRYDDRGVGKSEGNFELATTADFASDALAAVEYLKNHKHVRLRKIGIIGHSEGAMIAPMVAAQSKDLRFIVLLAGPGVPCFELLLEQMQLIARAEGEPEEKIQRTLRYNREIFDLVRKYETTPLMDIDHTKQQLTALLQKQFSELSEEERQSIRNPEQHIQDNINELLSPWFRYFIAFDPAEYLKKIKCAVLALNGSLDLQVPAEKNLTAIRSILRKAGNQKVTVWELPQLNHLFQTCKTGSPTEYGKIEETFSPSALKIIAEWIKKN